MFRGILAACILPIVAFGAGAFALFVWPGQSESVIEPAQPADIAATVVAEVAPTIEAEMTVEPRMTGAAAGEVELTPLERYEAYCRQVGTSLDWDHPAGGMTFSDAHPILGVKLVSDWVARCYEGKPLVCSCGATCGACMRASIDEPEGVRSWCYEHITGWPPMAVTGHSTIYEWECDMGRPVWHLPAGFDPSNSDKAGFSKGSWIPMAPHHIESPAP